MCYNTISRLIIDVHSRQSQSRTYVTHETRDHTHTYTVTYTYTAISWNNAIRASEQSHYPNLPRYIYPE
jgi:hypothetical protein